MPEGHAFSVPAMPAPENLNAPLFQDGNTYLHELCAQGAAPALIRAAVQKGADLQALNKQKMPPLGLALLKGSAETVACLLDMGAEIFFMTAKRARADVPDTYFNAVHLAATEGDGDKLRLVLAKGGARHVNEAGAEADGNSLQWHALHGALRKGHNTLIDPLMEAGAFIDGPAGFEKQTPLLVAIAQNSGYVVEKLLQQGAALENRHAATGNTPLLTAAALDKTFAAEKLLKFGADPNAVNDAGRTPLLLAAQAGNARLITALVRAGAKLDARDAEGRTPLMLAAEKNNTEAVTLLLKAGADPLLADKFNKTAAAIAEAKSANWITRQSLEEAEKTALMRGFERAYKNFRP